MINKRTIGEESREGDNMALVLDDSELNASEVVLEENDTETEAADEKEVSKEEKEAQREKNIGMLEELYEKRNKEAAKIFARVEDEVGESSEGIRSIKKMSGGVYAKVSFGLRQELSREQANIESKISDLEYSMLDIPKDMDGETSNPEDFKIEIPEDIRKLERKTNELVDDSITAREVLVENFIKISIFSIYGIKAHFADSFRETINGPNAKNIIAYKTEKEIRHAASGFIEKGEKADFGFRAQLEVSSYNRKVKEVETEKKFITGYTISIGGYDKKIRKNDNLRGSNFVPGSQSEEIQRTRGIKKKNVK